MSSSQAMTPHTFAKQECCNLMRDGVCIAREARLYSLYESRGSRVYKVRQETWCLLSTGRRCRYFERVVCRVADQPGPVNAPGLSERRQTAVSAYNNMHGLARQAPFESDRVCPDCGISIAKGRRVCDKCKLVRRRASKRGYARYIRKRRVDM